MSSLFETTKFKKPTAKVILNGRRVSISDKRGTIKLSQAFGNSVMSGSVTIVNPPETPQIMMSISISLGYNNTLNTVFIGIVKAVERVSYPKVYRLTVASPLYRAELVQQDIETSPLNNITAKTAVEQILSNYGKVNTISIPELGQEDGVPLVLGQLTPVSFSNTTALSAAQQICALTGHWLYDDAAGYARAIQLEGVATTATYRTLRRGEHLLVSGPPTRTSDSDQIKNRAVVRGANTGVEGAQIKDIWQAEHRFLPSGVYRTVEYQNNLIEFTNEADTGIASATGVAKRLVRTHNRNTNIIRIKITGDPRAAVGRSIAIQDKEIGFNEPNAFFIYAVYTTFGGGEYTQVLTLDGGIGEQGYTLIPPPVANFTFELFYETVEGDGDIVEVFLDGSISSTLAEGEIVAYDWADDQSPQNTATGQTAMFIYERSLGSVNITLTVTDTNSKISSVTTNVPFDGNTLSSPKRHIVSIAAGTTAYVSPDSGKTWNSDSISDSQATQPLTGSDLAIEDNSLFPILFGKTNGFSGTLDQLDSPLTPYGSVTGTPQWVSSNEQHPSRVWAAVGSKLYLSVDGGTTFTNKYTATDTINVVVESPDQNTVEILAGNKALWSYDGGSSFTIVLTHPESGAVAKAYTSGSVDNGGALEARHFVGFKNTTANPLLCVETGVTPSFTPSAPNEIRSLSFLVNSPVVIATDETGAVWSVDAFTGAATLKTATLGATAADEVNMSTRMGDENTDIVYIACKDSVRKYFPATDTVLRYKNVNYPTEEAYMVGFHGKSVGNIQADIIVFPFGSTKGILQYTPETFSFVEIAAPALWANRVYGAWICPNNVDVWCVRGFNTASTNQHTFFMTNNAGQSWIELPLPDTVAGGGTGVGIFRADFVWTGIGTEWYIAGYTAPRPSREGQYYARGDYTNVLDHTKWDIGQPADPRGISLARGIAGQVFASNSAWSKYNTAGVSGVYTIENGVLDPEDAGSVFVAQPDIRPGSTLGAATRQAIGHISNSAYYSADYSSSAFTVTASGGEFSAFANGVAYISGGNTAGIKRVTGFTTGSPVVTDVYATNERTGRVVTSVPGGNLVAVKGGTEWETNTLVYVYDGQKWFTLDMGVQNAVGSQDEPQFIAVIEREVI